MPHMGPQCTLGISLLSLLCIILCGRIWFLEDEKFSLKKQLNEYNQQQSQWKSKENEYKQRQEHDKWKWEEEINKLKQQRDADKTKYKQDMNRQNSEWQSKYDEEKKQSRENLKNVQNTVNLNKLITSQMHELEASYTDLGRKYEIIVENIKIYNNEINEINSEYKHIYQYHPDQLSESLSSNDEYIHNIVLLGETGHHKSTFGNRLCGDISFYAESSEFHTSTGSASCTKHFTKRIIKNLHTKIISVVDTPGFNDTDDDDRINAENLVSYLRGSGGIDAFVWVTKETKFTKNYENSLQKLEDLLGKEFWKHLIFIRSTVNDGTPAMRDHQVYSTKLRNSIRFKFDLDELVYKLPIIALDTYYHYKKPIIEEFIRLMPQNKFQCDKISSPITKLIENLKEKRNDLYDFQLQLNDMKNRFDLLCDKLNDSVNKMKIFDEGSYDIYSTKLLTIQNNAKIYDISSIDEQLMEIIEFSNKTWTEIDVKWIDFSDRNYIESVLPFITELNATEIYDISKQCNIEIDEMEKYVKDLYETYPDSVVTKVQICNLNNIASNCKSCIDENYIYADSENKECGDHNITEIDKPIHDKREEIINDSGWNWERILERFFIISGAIYFFLGKRLRLIYIYMISIMRQKQKVCLGKWRRYNDDDGEIAPDIGDNCDDKTTNPTDDA